MTTWPTHKAKARTAKQLANWRKKQQRKMRRLARGKQNRIDAERRNLVAGGMEW